MARSGLIALLVLASFAMAGPALAQFPNIFDTLFGNPPLRPPADVPGRPPSQPQYVPPPSGGLPPGPPPGSRIQTQPLPPPPGAASRPATAPVAPAPGQPPATPAALPPGQRPLPAQRGGQPATTTPQPGDEVVVEPPPRRIANPTAVFSGLDKITGRIISFDVQINETVRFGALEVTPRACYTRPPTEASNTDAFIEVDELTLQGELKRIFTGWMFAASPGLNAVEHPIYDVWLTDCKGAQQPAVAESSPESPAAQARPPQRAARPPQRATQQPLPPPPAPPR